MNFLVVGLGNIGAEYADTRHNMGFMVLDAWARASNFLSESRRYGALADLPFRGRHLYLLKPSTYMNLSGNAVRYWLQALHLGPEQLIVVCDDINLPFGTVRLRKQGSCGGHNGLRHIEECLGTQEWCRIRLGVGKDFHPGEQIDYVLSALSPEEKEQMGPLCTRVIEGIQSIALIGPDRTMDTLNGKGMQNGKK